MMKVTDVRVRRLNPEGRMKAVASVTLDGEFVIHDVRVVEGHNGLFVAMPSRKTPEGEFRDIAHPITTEARERIQTAVIKAFGDAQALTVEVAAAAAAEAL
jgi:stage V sporulation protein G